MIKDLTEQILSTPVPNLDVARSLRTAGYANVPLELDHPLRNDPLVLLSDYGIASQSYYSRKNSTGDPVPGVKPEVFLRKDVAERLAQANEFLQAAEFITRQCGGIVELFVDDGLRSIELQRLVHDEIYPNYLRLSNPNWSEAEILEKRDKAAAVPSQASPHASGGVADIKLRLIEGGHVGYGRDKAIRETMQTDYYEYNEGSDIFRVNRRIIFHTLTAAGLVNNPEEVWHYGRGDRLSHVVSPAIMPGSLIVPAYYAAVEGAPELDR